MANIPTRQPTWASNARTTGERIANLNLAIPTAFYRLRNTLAGGRDALEAQELKDTLTRMLSTLAELSPEHPHLNIYSLNKL